MRVQALLSLALLFSSRAFDRLHKVDDLFKGRTRREDLFDAHLLEAANILLRNDSAAENGDVPRLIFLKQPKHFAEQGHMGRGVDGKSNGVYIFLERRTGDLFRSVVDAEVDHLHAGIPQRASDDLNAAVVTVETDFGNQDAERRGWFANSGTRLY